MDVSSNKINNYKFILKYLVKADGVIPLEELDLSDNMFTKEDMAILLKNYLLKAKNDPQYTMKLRVREMEL